MIAEENMTTPGDRVENKTFVSEPEKDSESKLSVETDVEEPKFPTEKETALDSTCKTLYPPLNLPFRHSVVDGWIYPPFVKEEDIRKSASFQLREDDVFIATFPKCGTTWTQNIIYKLHQAHETDVFEGLGDHLLEAIPWLEDSDQEEVSQRPSPRYLKTHNPYQHLSKDPAVRCKYVVVTRNPKDACVSLYHHARAFSVFQFSGPEDFPAFAELFLQGLVESGDWWRFVREFRENREDLEILFLKYEDLHGKSEESVRRLNSFIGLPELSEEKLGEVISQTRFGKMSKDPAANYSWRDDARNEGKPPFMRKGKVGDWTNCFTKDLSDRFNEKTKQILGEFEMFEDYVTEFPETQ